VLRPNESLQKLTFADAMFDDAIPTFVAYLTTRSMMIDLSFTTVSCFQTDGVFPGKRIAEFLSGPSGAGVKALCVEAIASLDGLWSRLNATEVNQSRTLRCVKLPSVDDTGDDAVSVALRVSNEAMMRPVPDLFYLRKLWLGQVPRDVDVFLRIMKENSSLHEVRFNADISFKKSEVAEFFLDLFGECNAKLPALVAGHQQLKPGGKYAPALEGSTVSLLPEIFSATQQMPRMAPTYMLTALLASLEEVGLTRIN
jgi:hypothetical protein